jgi:PA domain
MRTLLRAAALAAVLALSGISSAQAAGRIIVVNGNLPGIGFNDPTPAAPIGGNTGTTLGEQRMNVFQFAADIWTAVLNPSVDIYVWARFVPLAPNVLGSAGPISVSRGFPGAEYPDLWYHDALANHLRGADPVPHDATFLPNAADTANPSDEISARFSTNFAFYLGLDNNEESVPNTNDLLVVVLHEMGHGLGFSNLVNEGDGSQFMGFGDLYSQYTLDVVTNQNWNAMTNEERAASALNLRKVSWTGLNVKKDVPSVLSPGEPFLRANSPAGIGPFLFGTAAFGTPLSPAGVTGDLVLGDDGTADPVTTDGCVPLVNNVAGKVVLLDRGVCNFTIKVKNAQNAGAIAVVIADNVAGGPPSGLAGSDATITIPSGRVTLADGNALKANLAAGVNVTLGLDTSILAGTDRLKKLMLLATFDPVQLGSSISHFDGVASRNQLMEPAINPDLTASVTPPEDLTTSLFTDIGWYSDADGVPDGTDSCIGSDTRPTVILGKCDSRANNTVMTDGCSVSDRLDECSGLRFDKYLACVAKKTDELARKKVITRRNEVGILLCAITQKPQH